ncbi:MAG TPA: DNA repair protein RecO [Gammaproteobacteria bacterium]|jgi:DNA repair protein RecO (recombination protein O)|nr:DNA repair protein RecO [Gammaproteobacteria bacterium]
MERASLEPAYILHQRPWRDSSLLIEAFSRRHGRVGLIARGARRSKSKQRALLQPFQPLLLSWTGRGDLATLAGVEAAAAAMPLAGSALFCGFYLNELLMRLLHRHDPHPRLFDDYAAALAGLAGSIDEEVALRLFEKRLLAACGYGLNLTSDIMSGEAVKADREYEYVLEQGPRVCGQGAGGLVLGGSSLLALAADRLDDERVLREVKKLLRAALDMYLGGKPLKTREVLRALRR